MKIKLSELSEDMLIKYLKDKKIKKSTEEMVNESVEMTEAELIKYKVFQECNE